MDELQGLMTEFYPEPTDADREARRNDLLRRAALVRAHGWDSYLHVWSTGEAAGVAALLGDERKLKALDETLHSVMSRWAFDLWGFVGGHADVKRQCVSKRAWFLDTSRAL